MDLVLVKQSQAASPSFAHPGHFNERNHGLSLAVISTPRGQEAPRAWCPPSLIMALGGPVLLRRGAVHAQIPTDGIIVLEEGAQYSVRSQRSASVLTVMLGAVALNADATQQSPKRRLLPTLVGQADPIAGTLQSLSRRCRFEPEGLIDDQSALNDFLSELWARQRANSHLMARCPGRTLAHQRDVLMRLSRVASLLDAPGGAPADLATLADLASYSPTHFLRLFSAVYGASPHDYQVNVRLAKARRMLAETGLAVRDIAEAVGFDSRSTFNRLFRRAFGTSAADLRQRLARSSHSRGMVREIGASEHAGAHAAA